MVDSRFESCNTSRDHIELDWIEGACRRCGAHVVNLVTEPIFSSQSRGVVEQFAKFEESKIIRFLMMKATGDRPERFSFW